MSLLEEFEYEHLNEYESCIDSGEDPFHCILSTLAFGVYVQFVVPVGLEHYPVRAYTRVKKLLWVNGR